MDRKSIPFQFNKVDDRCSESSIGINKGTSDDSASEIEDVILDFESIRSSDADTDENNSKMFCNCLPRLGMGGKMCAVVLFFFIIFCIIRMVLIN